MAASKTLVLRCGDKSVPWDILEVCTRGLEGLDADLNSFIFTGIPGLQIRLPLDLTFVREAFRTRSLVLSNILWMARKFEATDPRDKIYALLGLAEDADA